MLQSKLFGKSTKTIPSDIQSVSHKYLYQGGFIRQMASGRYTFLPLGFRVWNKILHIIENEMCNMGSQRVITPTLQPIEFWQATNRDKAFGGEMMIVDDHHGSTFAIGATAEGQMVELVKKFNPSYKDLPILIHQFSSKFRDEKRPRGGLLRVREFTMKDAYSFCKSPEEQGEIYQKFYQAYIRLCKLLDLETIPVEADSGALGGKICHEFMVMADSGEDKIFICNKCGYAANSEKAEFFRQEINPNDPELPLKDVYQPASINTIDEMSKFFKIDKNRILKNVLYKGSDDKYYIAIIRGDLEINETKLAKNLDLDFVEPASPDDLKKMSTTHGSVPVKGLKNVSFVGDISLKTVKNFTGGYKRESQELEWQNVNLGRDFKVEKLLDIAEAKAGDTCTKCDNGKLEEKRAIEFGHVFNQELFYTKPHKAYFVDQDGTEKPMWMGAYGIGLGRAMATIIETHHDDKGIIWPENVAPFKYHLINLSQDNKIKKQAENTYQQLLNRGDEVLFDDRPDASPGEKLKDSDLIGIPHRLIVSDKTNGKIEFKKRNQNKAELKDISEI